MKIAQGDPYSPREMTGDAEPTMMSPKAHRTPTRRAMAGPVPSLETQPARWRVSAGRVDGGAGAGARRADRPGRRLDRSLWRPAGRVVTVRPGLEGWRRRVESRVTVRSATVPSSGRWGGDDGDGYSEAGPTHPSSLHHLGLSGGGTCRDRPGPGRAHQTLPTERKSP